MWILAVLLIVAVVVLTKKFTKKENVAETKKEYNIMLANVIVTYLNSNNERLTANLQIKGYITQDWAMEGLFHIYYTTTAKKALNDLISRSKDMGMYNLNDLYVPVDRVLEISVTYEDLIITR